MHCNFNLSTMATPLCMYFYIAHITDSFIAVYSLSIG